MQSSLMGWYRSRRERLQATLYRKKVKKEHVTRSRHICATRTTSKQRIRTCVPTKMSHTKSGTFCSRKAVQVIFVTFVHEA